jgi:hypothetical protein
MIFQGKFKVRKLSKPVGSNFGKAYNPSQWIPTINPSINAGDLGANRQNVAAAVAASNYMTFPRKKANSMDWLISRVNRQSGFPDTRLSATLLWICREQTFVNQAGFTNYHSMLNQEGEK